MPVCSGGRRAASSQLVPVQPLCAHRAVAAPERLRVLRMVSSRVPAGLGLFLEPVTGLRIVISPEGKALVRACLVLSSTVESMWVPAAPSPTDM